MSISTLPECRATNTLSSTSHRKITSHWLARVIVLMAFLSAIQAADILFVVGNPTTLSNGDTKLRNRMQALGHVVTAVDDDVVTAANASGKALVVITESVESSKTANKGFENLTIPVITSDSGVFPQLKMTNITKNIDFGTVATQDKINIINAAHPLAAELSGLVTVATSALESFDWGVPSNQALKIATQSGNANKFTLFAYESGATMVGMNAPARRVAWFAEDGGANILNANGNALFDAAVTWALGGSGGGVISGGKQGPGLPKQSFSATSVMLDNNVRELAKIAVPPKGTTDGYGHGRVSMMGGYLFVPFFTEDGGSTGGGFDLYELSAGSGGTLPASTSANASSLTPKLRVPRPTSGKTIREAHGYGLAWVNGKRMLVMQAENGIEIWDMTTMLNPQKVKNFPMTLTGTGNTAKAYAGIWWVSLQWPYAYMGENSGGIRIVDLSNPINPVHVKQLNKTEIGGFNVGSVHAIGNLLIVTSNSQSSASATDFGGGYTFFDISDPINPQLINTYSGASWPRGYSSMVNGERLIIGGTNNSFHLLDVSDPANVKTFPLLRGPGPGGYINYQDGHAFSGYQSHAIKVDIRNANVNTAPTLARKGTIAVVAADTGDINFAMPLGNMLFAANDRIDKGSALIVHDAAVDNKGPEVDMVRPKNGATGVGVKTRIGLTFTDELADYTLTTDNITLRRQGTTTPIAGTLSYQINMVNFTPSAPLQTGTTYEVVVRTNGIADVSDNTTSTQFISTFTTEGAGVTPVDIVINKPSPILSGATANFSIASATGSGTLRYKWNFGDGTSTSFLLNSNASHAYSAPGHYVVSAQVMDANGTVDSSQIEILTVSTALTANAPSSSGPLGLIASLNRLYTVNPDADTVTVINTTNNTKVTEIPVGKNPRSLAVRDADKTIWVTNQDSSSVSVINANTNTVIATIPMPRASQPFGIAVAPNQSTIYVSLYATGQLVKLDPATRVISGAPINIGPTPRAVAVNHNSSRILVTRFISNDAQGEVVEVNAGTNLITRTFTLAKDTMTIDDERQARGVANYLSSVAISPDGSVAWVPAKKDNIERGLNRDGKALNFENSVRTILNELNISGGSGAQLLDFNDSDSPSAVTFTPRGDQAYVAMQGNNQVVVVNLYEYSTSLIDVGLAPQGVLVNDDGTRLYVQNFMSRSVSVFDISGITNFTTGTATFIKEIATVATEKLTPSVLAGKKIFYDATSTKMNTDGYISCASCHIDGGHDGRVWDFTDRGEGFRRTTDLRGRSGVGHGPVHWTGNFDEIHDFEHDMRGPFAGAGFMQDSDFNTGTRNTSLGLAKAGVSADLDNIAAYVSSLTSVPDSPWRNQNGALTTKASRGKTVFINNGCATCHSGPRMTDSSLNRFHDVGTATQPTSGKRLGATLTGFDTPTLKGLWTTGRYLHDGSQTQLLGAFQSDDPTVGPNNHKVVLSLSDADRSDLFEYLDQIDEAETPAYLPAGADNLVVIEAESFSAVQAPIGQEHSWIPVINASTYANTIALQALPNKGTVINAGTSNANDVSPRADYLVQFPAAGTYTVWIRGMGASTADNSVYISVNGQAPTVDTAFGLTTTNGWVKYPLTITVAAGIQTISMWMREDGVVIDRLLLTTNAQMSAPIGSGPNESKTTITGGAPAVIAPVITTQPTNVTVSVGDNAIFTVAANGTNPLTYVWKRGATVVGGNSSTLQLNNVSLADAGTYTCTVSNFAGSAVSSSAILTVNQVVQPAFQQDNGTDGLLVIEAENPLGIRTAAGGKSWNTVTTPTGFSGAGAIQALANTGVSVDIANLSTSPRVDYPINFTKTGTHYIWIRGLGATTADNSMTVGLDGVATTTSDNVTFSTAYAWKNLNLSGSVRTINVASTGVHTLNLWMREDGVVGDKILLTVTPSYIPAGNGPNESSTTGSGTLPAPWVTGVIGNAVPEGSASAVNNVFTISGSGAGIWGSVDAFRAVNQEITGDCDFVARVDSIQNTHAWAMAGVMLRSSLDADSAHATTAVTPLQGVNFRSRGISAGSSRSVAGPLVSTPYWVKISRRGNRFTSYSSSDGAIWVYIGGRNIDMPTTIQACLAVTSKVEGVLCTTVISQVAVTPVASN